MLCEFISSLPTFPFGALDFNLKLKRIVEVKKLISYLPAIERLSSWGEWGSCSKTCVGLDLVEGVKQLMDVDFHFLILVILVLKNIYRKEIHNLQTKSRSRSCNVAQHGGSTATCTTAETETQPCLSQMCDGKINSQC